MTDRESLHSRFARTFHIGDDPQRATDTELDAIESALHTTLPVSYRAFATSHGTVYTPDILDAVAELDHPDVQNFASAPDVITDTKAYWGAGMPDNIVAFASDCMGNMFAFERGFRETRPDDLPVLFFDHDFVEVAPVAESFDALLMWFLDNALPKTEA